MCLFPIISMPSRRYWIETMDDNHRCHYRQYYTSKEVNKHSIVLIHVIELYLYYLHFTLLGRQDSFNTIGILRDVYGGNGWLDFEYEIEHVLYKLTAYNKYAFL